MYLDEQLYVAKLLFHTQFKGKGLISLKFDFLLQALTNYDPGVVENWPLQFKKLDLLTLTPSEESSERESNKNSKIKN